MGWALFVMLVVVVVVVIVFFFFPVCMVFEVLLHVRQVHEIKRKKMKWEGSAEKV